MLATLAAAPALASPYASQVVAYLPGAAPQAGLTDPARALGEPSRFNADPNPQWAGAVTPFAAPYLPDQIVSIGVGGSLTVRFDQPVTNDPLNPFGIDLLVFGNSFFFDPLFAPVATLLSSDGGRIEVSPDGVSWTAVQNVAADGLFPTLGYVDITDPFGGPAGSIPTDFTRPVNPNLAWQGLGWQALVAAYDGSGGGAGVDLGLLGLQQISFVRVSLPAGAAGANIEIDGFSDVSAIPAPGGLALLAPVTLAACRRRRGGRSAR